jgi:hypothetical protein
MKINPKILMLLLVAVVTCFSGCLPEEENGDTADERDKFLGVWKVDESCNKGNFSVTITKDPDNSAQVLLDNFGNPGPGYEPAVGLVVGQTIVVSPQVIGEDWNVNGDGIYDEDSDTIGWDYTLDIGGSQLTCTALFWK